MTPYKIYVAIEGGFFLSISKKIYQLLKYVSFLINTDKKNFGMTRYRIGTFFTLARVLALTKNDIESVFKSKLYSRQSLVGTPGGQWEGDTFIPSG